MEVVFTSDKEGESPVEAIMVVEEGCERRLEEIAEEGARGCVGVCRIPNIAVEVTCA